ncbi:NAD-dependent dehydratase [Halomonas sp. BC04]|nr:NAD-dependent dehydratase [Halomonas sp. BC04]
MYNAFNSWGWLDRCDATTREAIEVFAGDVRDPYGVKQAMQGCDVVFHLAALIAIPYSYHSPETYVDTNIKGTLNILQAARELGIERVVHTSTSEVYGTAITVPIDESHPLQGQSPYSASKIGADQLALSFHRSFSTPVSLIRPFNTYGPRQSARAVIPTIITQIAAGTRRLRLGALYPTRDFSYVDDTVAGFIRVAECDDAVGQVINVGSGFEVSIGETAQLIADLMGAEVTFEIDEQRLRPARSEVERLWADTTRAESWLGHVPEYSGMAGLSRGLEKTIDWFIWPDNLSHYKSHQYNL